MEVSASQLQPTRLDIGIRRLGCPDLDVASIPTNSNGPGCARLPNPTDRPSSGGLQAGTVRNLQELSYTLAVLFNQSTLVGITRQPTQSEYGEVVLGDDIDRSSRAPHLDQPRVIPSVKVNVFHPSVKREQSRPRNTVLKTHIRSLVDVFPGESPT